MTVLTTCQKGGKNAEYIGQLFKDKVAEFDPTSTCTDEFFFDNASNVQQAGEILCSTYPTAFCFHGGKHMLSLFFSDLATFPINPSECAKFLFAPVIVISNFISESHSQNMPVV